MVQLILLEDELDLREALAELLTRHGYGVTEAGSIAEFRLRFGEGGCDIAILDRMLPDGDGLALATELRQAGNDCGIIVLTARDASAERIDGYEQGADHYLGKPVRSDELLSILAALTRRLKSREPPAEPRAGWRLDSSNWSLHTPQGHTIGLTAQEFVLLRTLATAPQYTASRKDIIHALGKNYSNYDPRSMDSLLKRLRRKVADAYGVSDSPLPIKTVHASGFALMEKIQLSES